MVRPDEQQGHMISQVTSTMYGQVPTKPLTNTNSLISPQPAG